MKNLFITIVLFTSLSLHSQAHIGASGSFDLESEYAKLGVGINYMLAPKVSLGGGVMITPFDVDDDYEMRYYDLTRERDGIVLNLDYVSNSGSKTYLHLFHNEYEDVEYRAKWEVRDVMEEYTPTISGTVATYGASRMDTEGKNRTEIRSIDNLAIGHETQLANGGFLEVQVFRSEAEQDDTDRYNLIFRSKEKDGVTTLDTANPQKPVLGLPSEFYDASTFPGKVAEQEYALTEDEEQGFKIDYTYMIGETVVQTGLKYRQREKINNYQFCEYDMPKGTTLADYDYQTIGKYLANTHGPAPTFEQVKSIVTNNTLYKAKNTGI